MGQSFKRGAIGYAGPMRIVGRYAVFDAIASGGMATVHLGRLLGPKGFSRTVAIKQMHPSLASDPEFVSMFLDEAKLAARVRHPNVVATLDVVELETELFLVMEYVAGESLSRLVRKAGQAEKRVPTHIAVAIVAGALRGLHAAHEATNEQGELLGIVHRDVSPHTILVGADGQARVLDFGVAKAAGRAQTTREGQIKGKLTYMSPEQMLGHAVDRRTDVFAASIVLWETLTGTRLFTAEDEGATVTKILSGDIEAPSAVVARSPAGAAAPELDLVRALDPLVLRGLAKDPANRFATAREMADAIEAAVAPARAAEVAAWVEETAADALRSQAMRVAEIESRSSLPPDSVRSARSAAVERPAGDDGTTRVEASVSRRREPAKSNRWWVWAVMGLAAAAGAAVSVGVARSRASARTSAATASASPSTQAVTLLDLPMPASTNPEALALYQQGLHAYRDGVEDSFEMFQKAARLDPALAVAHLRVLIAIFDSEGPENEAMRLDAYRGALAGRDRLSERDRGIVDALEPVMLRQPADWAATEEALGRLVAKYPSDADLLEFAGSVYGGEDKYKEADALLARAITIDPQLAQAWIERAYGQEEDGDFAGAAESSSACLAASPRATGCLEELIYVRNILGNCDQLSSLAHRHIATSPDDPKGYLYLFDSELALGEPEAAVDVTMDQALAKIVGSPYEREALTFPRVRAILRGDFVAAQDVLGRQEQLAVRQGNPTDQLAALAAGAELAREMGDLPKAGKMAQDYLARSAAAPPPTSFIDESVYRDATPWALGLARDAGLVSADAAREKRDAWIRTWESRLRGPSHSSVWFNAYARPASTAADAKEALDHAPGDLKRLSLGTWLESEAIGRVYLLAGQYDQAVPYLQNAASQCGMRKFPLLIPRARNLFGLALEGKGDRDGACVAFGAVLARWGRAKPSSVTAKEASAHARALHCEPTVKP